MGEKRSGIKIFPKLLLTMLVISAIPLAGLWYLSAFTGQKILKDNLDTSLSRVATAAAADVNGWIDMNQRALRQNAALEHMTSMQPMRQEPILKATKNAYEWTYLVFTTDFEGNNIARSDDKSLKFYGDRQYFLQVSNGADVGQQVLIGRTSKKPALCLSVPIDRQARSLAGVLVACSHLNAVSAAITDIKFGNTGKAFLVDNLGRLVAHSDPTVLTRELQNFSKHPVLASGADQANVVFEENGKKIVAYPQKLSLDWTLVVQQDYDDAFGPLYEAQRNSFIVIGVTITLVLLAALLFARNLVGPIRKLTDVADASSRGKQVDEIPGTGRADEVGDLARAVKRMGVSIQMAFEELKKNHSKAA